MRFEPFEPRVLLSADFLPEAAAVMAHGLDHVGEHLDNFLTGDTFDQRVPLLLKVSTDDQGRPVNEAPTVGDVLSVPVDANGDGEIDGLPFFDHSDDDEPALDALDANHDGRVDAGEFLKGWFFDPASDFLNAVGSGDTTTDFENFLKGSFFFNLDQHLDHLGDYLVDFKIVDAKVHDTTENPDAEVTFSVGFELTISHAMPIDLGLEGDAIKLLPFTGSSSDPQPVKVPVETTLSFGFDFGVFTGGKTPSQIVNDDFFVRKADPLLASVVAKDPDLDFNLNIGFLGAQVVNGNFDLQADLQTKLLDPNDPAVLGFTDGQRGVESTSGVVTAANSLPGADLAHDAGFFLRIGNVGITTPVLIADGNAPDNATLKSQIGAALASAGLGDLVNADITGGKVQFALVSTSDTPLGFANESLGLGGIIDATPDGDGPNAFEYTSDQVFLLSVGGHLAHVVRVHFPDPAKSDIGFDYAQAASLPGSEDQVIAASAPSASDISADANFTVTVTQSDGTQHTQSFTLSATDTDGNADAGDLAADIDGKLDGTLFPLVMVIEVGGKIRFEGIDSSVAGIRVQASGTATGEIGFASDASATLLLSAANNAVGSGDLSGTARFDVTVKTVGGGTTTKHVSVAADDNGNVADLAADIDAALAAQGLAIDAMEVGGKIVLKAQNVNVAAFDIKSGNQTIDDLVADVNAALADAGLGSEVTASSASGKLRLDAGGDSIEISKTLTFDAGVTHHELVVTPTHDLFAPEVGGASHATFDLPVKVLAGLEDATTVADDDWNPQNVALVANFSPLGSSVADYDAQAKRFALHFSYDPTVENQDTPVGSVPSTGSLSEEIRLVNMAEPLNFNLLGAENMVGLIMGLGTALQQISDSSLFAGYDVPFTGKTLSDLLKFTDADKKKFSGLVDLLIYDTGGDGIDGSNADTDKLLKKVTVDSESFLIPAFVTAQELASRLHTVLDVALSGAGGINAAYDTGTNELTYHVDLIAGERTKVSFDTPFQYDVSLSPFAKMTVDAAAAPSATKVTLEGRTGLDMTFGVDLSPPGAVIFPDTPLAELNGGSGVDIKKVRAITGTVDIPVAGPNDDPVYQLAGDATFSISVNGATAIDVSVLKASTLNRSMGDLAADINNSLAAAGLSSSIVAQFDGTRVVLAARNAPTTFSIASANAFAQSGLGLNAGMSANQTDFVITASDGSMYAIVLDTLPMNPSVQDVIDNINTTTSGNVTADFNATHTGLRLVDHTVGSHQFRVESVNASNAVLGLGFFGAGNTGTQNHFGDGDPHLIEGGGIGVTHLDKRFFVRDAQMRLDGIQLHTPGGGVPGEALFGIVGVDTTMDGSMVANMTAALKDPVSGSQVTLAELLAQTGAVANPLVSKAQHLAYDNLAIGAFNAGDFITGNTSGATAVVVGVDGGTLTLAHVTGNFTNDEFFFSKGVAAVAQANGSQSVNDVFGEFTLGVDVQPGFNSLGFGSGFGALDGMSYVVPVDLTAFGDPFGPNAPTAALDLSGIGDLAAFEHLNYSHLAAALHGLEAVLADVDSSFVLFNTKLPAINRSVSDLLHLVDGFARSVDNADFVLDTATAALDPAALDLPALSLQGMAQALRGAFGLPVGVDPDAPDAVDFVRLDFDQANNLLLLDLSLNQTLSTKLGLDIDVGSGLPKLTSGGVLKVSSVLDVELHTAIDLDTPQDAYLLDTSSISAELHVEGEGQKFAGGEDGAGMVFYASLGPLAVFIQDADAGIDVSFSLPGLDFGGSDRKLIKDVVFEDFDDAVVSQNNIDIVLPMFYGGEGPNAFMGQFTAQGPIETVSVVTPDFSSLAGQITSGAIAFDPFENISLAIDTVNIYLESLTDALSSRILSLKLPFIGDQMADELFIDEFRETLVGALKSGIENAINPNPDTIVQGILTGLFGTGGALEGYLQGAIVATDNVGDVAAANSYRQWNFKVGRSETLLIDDFDFGIPNLGFDVDTPVQVQFDWSVDLGFGVNFGQSAYIDVSHAEDIDVNLTITLPGGTHDGTYGFLPTKVTDPGADTGAKVAFKVDVQNGADAASEHLAFSDLGSIDPVATVQGSHLPSEPHSTSLHLVTQAMPGLPELRTDLLVDWSLPSTEVESLDGDAVAAGTHRIALEHIELDSGSIAEQLLGPLFGEVASFIEPFMPVVDTLTAPIPILSDLAGEPFTLLDLAGIFGDVDPRFIDAVADILDVIASINDFINAPVLELGDMVLYDDAAGITNFDPHDPGSKLSDINIDALDPLSPTSGLTLDPTFDATVAGNSFLSAVRDHALAEDLSVPILEKQREGIKLFLDQNATLLQYELPPLAVSFDYLQVFPVVGPLAVSIEISFGFDVNLHAVGFDTFGYKRYAEGGFRNPALVFDGFFFKDSDSTGTDAPEVKLEFGLVGAAEINLGIARAGVGGGIDATITFDWHDAIADDHVHLSEIAGAIAAEGNPLAAFDVGGSLTFEMFAFIEFLTFRQDIPITPETTLYSFEDTSKRDPILATRNDDGTLYLNMGPNAKDRLNGDTSDGNEEFNLEYQGSGKVLIWSDKLGVSKSQGKTYSGVNHIVGLGGQGNDVILLDKFDGSGITADLDGGVGDDRIEYTGSSASHSVPGARIVGGLGNDILTGGDANDVIYGGEGNDIIKGGGGYDILFGDQGKVADTLSAPFISSRITSSDGDDTIEGGDGDDVIFGGGGSDTLKGDGGNDVIIGDGGRFEYTTTGGHVDIASLRPAAYLPTPVTTPVDPELISSQIDVIYIAMAGTFQATDLGFGGNDKIFGGADNDMILGGSGDDTVHGEGGDDIILGGKGFDDLHGGDNADSIFGGDQADTIAGDAGADVISGGAGNDFIHGNAGNDVMKGDTGADVMFGDENDDQVFGQTEPDILFGGIGNDLVVGGTGNDTMFGDDGLVAKIDPSNGLAAKAIGIGNLALLTGAFFDNDIRTTDLIVTDVVAGDGNDIISGDAGDDLMLGGGGNDLMGGDVDPRLAAAGSPTETSEDVLIGDGGKIVFDQRHFHSIETVIGTATGVPFDDTIYGDNGNDYIFGGRGSDFLFGGHGKVVTGGVVGAARGATDASASDNDIIVGDNGEMLFAGKTPVADNFGVLSRVRTTDLSDATGGHEYVEGELGADVIFGGVNGSVDVLFGNAGNDVILGDDGELDFDFDGTHDLTTLDLIRSYLDGLGGTDQISGNAGGDVLIGGTGGDQMYGDDANASTGAADGEDIMLGDNADIFLIGTSGRLKVQVATMTTGTAVDRIMTTDNVGSGEGKGGADTMSGNAKADIMLGGVNNGGQDNMYGDRAAPTGTTIDNDGNDIMLGDNGELDFTFSTDTDRNTLDLIRSYEDGMGGTDVMSGNKGLDVAIGGSAGDQIYGDDAAASAAAADLGDLLLGDNADVFLVAQGGATGPDLKVILGAAVMTIRTTDEEHPEYGGADIISGNAKGDIIAGGVKGDTLYGDRATPTLTTSGNDGGDVILGDNAAFEWRSTGRLSEIQGIDIAANNPALYAKYGTGIADTNLGTLDLITTEQPTSGGRDTIYGDEGSDLAFGGTDLDLIHGDDGDEVAAVNGSANADVLFGDHGRLYPQFSTLANFNSRNFFAIDTGNAKGGEGDVMWGEEGDDVMLGQQGDDRMWGGSGDDDMIGGHNVSGGYDELTLPAVQSTVSPGPVQINDLMDGGTGKDAMTGDNAIVWRRGDDISPRFRLLTAGTLYTTTNSTITANVGAVAQSDPDDAVGRDITLVDHSDDVQATPLGRFGNDVMAGGAGSDTLFGELGNDLMQGDGSIAVAADPGPNTRLAVTTDSGLPNSGGTLYFNIPEAITDGDDYIEGNGGNDLMYGGLGQDDMIGGSSALFGLNTEDKRPDGSDTIFGGAGIDISRNNVGDANEDGTTHVIATTPTGHARDADFIMGDNANILRPVKGPDDFLTFNYDNYTSALPAAQQIRIVPHVMQQLDYTLGGGDYAGGGYNAIGQAMPTGKAVDNGLADLIHGESGDDIIFGMTGSDVIFGEGQDDDIVGGYGNDWISGGTGQDGVLGDDGLIRTSRNSTAGESLYGVAPLLPNSQDDPKTSQGNVLDELISTPGTIQIATINISGELKKTFDITPMSYDPGWIAQDDEFPNNTSGTPFADDIIFGGLGSDWLHGGSGDDAISGAEALDHAYVPVFAADGITPTGTLDLGYLAVGIPNPTNPGNVLAFNSQDLDGRHLNNRFRAGEFRLYDEYDPLREILLTDLGELSKTGTGKQFLLNFEKGEGVLRDGGTVPKATGQQTDSYGPVRDDGRDSIFGDLGNDWLVGGTGRDDLFGGWGNDLINADDDQTTNGTLNDQPDTHPYYEDRAYGGAGRDVLIGNTGGDRLIDWVGEYNSFLVPYAPFGQASVSRTLMPHLHEFLYALSAADGADPTRFNDTGADSLRNGEPDAEMGLVLQKDFAWGDQTGAPADPQAGNIPGGKRDVLRSAGFNDGTLSGFAVDKGSFAVQNGALSVAAASLGKDATAVLPTDEQLPTYYEVLSTITVDKPTSGWKGNSYIVFDYFDAQDFKFAGLDISNNKVVMGYHDVSGWHSLKETPWQLKGATAYNVMVAVNGTAVTLSIDNKSAMSYTYAPRVIDGLAHGLNMGLVGLGSDNSRGTFDNFSVQRVPPAYTLQQTEQFTTGTGDLFDGLTSGNWLVQAGRYDGTAPSASLVDLGIGRGLETSAILELSAKLRTDGKGGFIFDRYADNDYKFVTIDAPGDKVVIGHVSPKEGLKIDASFAKVVDSGIDYTLAVMLKGTSISVSLNGQAVGSFVFNGVTVDGGFGVISSLGKTSFDSVTVKTNDRAFAVAQSMVAAQAPSMTPGAQSSLTPSDIDSMFAAAEGIWANLLGAGDSRLALLGDVQISTADFGGLVLGQTRGMTILVDEDAAGYGWFVDASPADNNEFRIRLDHNALGASRQSGAFGRMDLLTVVTHELGHVLGFEHDEAGIYAVMHDDLDSGVRYLLDGPALQERPGLPSDEQILMRLAIQTGRSASSLPAFDLDSSAPRSGVGVAIDWNDRLRGSLGTYFSPFGSTSPKSAQNFADFMTKIVGSSDGASADDNDSAQFNKGSRFDKMGSALNAGKYARRPMG